MGVWSPSRPAAARKSGKFRRPIRKRRCPSPARHALPMAASSSVRPVPNSSSAATWQPTAPTPVRSCGAGGLCRGIRRKVSSSRSWPGPRRPGAGSGGKPAAAVPPGTVSITTRSPIWSTSVRATARPGPRRSARRAAATTCSPPRSLRWTQRPASTAGITRRRRTTASISTARSRSSRRTSSSTVRRSTW